MFITHGCVRAFALAACFSVSAVAMVGCAAGPLSGGPNGELAAADSRADSVLKAALLDLRERDQAARAAMIELMQSAEKLPGGGFKISSEQHGIMTAVQDIDAESTAFLKKMVAERGWPRISEIGEDGASAAWILAQHADKDPEFQAEVLELMKPLVAEGEASGVDFALLTDRVLVARGEKQVYATQFTTDENNVMRPGPTVDWDRVAERRAEVGLPTLEEYRRIMIDTYGGEVELLPTDQVD